MVHIRSRGDSGTGKRSRKKMQDIIRFYTQTSHGFHFTIYFPIGPCEETSQGGERAKEGARIRAPPVEARDFARLLLGARNRAPRGRRAGPRAWRWARRFARLGVGAPVRVPFF